MIQRPKQTKIQDVYTKKKRKSSLFFARTIHTDAHYYTIVPELVLVTSPPLIAELVLTFHSHTQPLPSLCRVESGTHVQSCLRSPLCGPSIARPCPAIATDPSSLLSKNFFYWVYSDFIGRFFNWKDCFKEPLYTDYQYILP